MERESRKRSVDNLQRIYTIVVGLAVAEVLRRVLGGVADGGPLPSLRLASAAVSFLVTLVPFYHAANRYLDETYVLGQRGAKPAALMLDLAAVLKEGLLFFVLALFVTRYEVFYTLLAALFVYDVAWVGLTRLTAGAEEAKGAPYGPWVAANLIAAALVVISVWSNAFKAPVWSQPVVEVAVVTLVVFARTVFDYASVWAHYYPAGGDGYIMPVPRPAVPAGRTVKTGGVRGKNS